jgi:hypothetical protein
VHGARHETLSDTVSSHLNLAFAIRKVFTINSERRIKPIRCELCEMFSALFCSTFDMTTTERRVFLSPTAAKHAPRPFWPLGITSVRNVIKETFYLATAIIVYLFSLRAGMLCNGMKELLLRFIAGFWASKALDELNSAAEE